MDQRDDETYWNELLTQAARREETERREQEEAQRRYAEELGYEARPTLTPAEQMRRNYLAWKEAQDTALGHPVEEPTWKLIIMVPFGFLCMAWVLATILVPLLILTTVLSWQEGWESGVSYEVGHQGADSNWAAVLTTADASTILRLWVGYAVLTAVAGVAYLVLSLLDQAET